MVYGDVSLLLLLFVCVIVVFVLLCCVCSWCCAVLVCVGRFADEFGLIVPLPLLPFVC